MVYNQTKNVWGDTRTRFPQFFLTHMINISTLILITKYIAAAMITIGIVCAPAWIARQTDKGKQDMFRVRLGSWLFGWSIVGWFYALFIGTRK